MKLVSSLRTAEMRGSTSLGQSPGRLADPKDMETIYNSKDVCPLASCTPLMENTFDQSSMGPGTDGDVQGFHDSMCGPMCVCLCARACFVHVRGLRAGRPASDMRAARCLSDFECLRARVWY